MHIVHVYNWLDPSNGGPPRVIASLARAQQNRGHTVSFISSDRRRSPDLDRFLADYFVTAPPRTVVRPKFFRPIWHRARLRRALSGADVAHLHGIWPPATLLASQTCRGLGLPYVLAPHGSLHHGALTEKRPRKLLGMHLLGYGAMVKHAAALHVLNSEEADGVPRRLLPERVEVIPNGVFADHFAELPEAGLFRGELGIGDAPYVLFLSRLHWGKGCDLLAAAFAGVARALPEVHLVVAGGDQGGRAMFEAGAARHGYTDRLHLVGEIRGARKHQAFRDAALFVLPSRHEGFSMAITEAMAWGKPVVITEPCHFPEVASEGCGVVTSLEPAAIAEGLLRVLRDPDAEAMGARGRALVLGRYRWEDIADRTLELYRRVIDRPAAH